ncbi:uncharacterized protein YMR315W isoform X4 [Tripterygium wilfordii]|uniref:uncharacterized protein YMR315W isoform X4 n=1 Tax=Tripterygium wilfordii TaxID=458696 RepID=UPI0018F7E56F|nr:uncharacterized protein YMR315W isoform X4 [Tripterygium wilfordii]
MAERPQIAILGAGIFVKTQYIPRLTEISDLFVLKAIWSRTEESARNAVEVARKHFPGVDCKWGDRGLEEIIQDPAILGVAVVLAAQTQVDFSLKLLKAGKHVIQEKPAAVSTIEAETALSRYKSFCANSPGHPIWAVAENYRFEPAFAECKKLMPSIGDMMNVQVIVEGSMNSANPYFSSSWRRDFTGGFILDMGVHFIAGLRMLVGCEVVSVSALTSHVDVTLPPPDNISANFQLDNGCSGVFTMVVSSRSPKVSFYGADGNCKSFFYGFSGVTEELKTFVHDISGVALKGSGYETEPRSSFVEAARDVAVLEAMLISGTKNGALVQVKQF